MIKFAVIGSGPMAEHHLQALQSGQDTPPVGIFSRNRQRARLLADRFRIKVFDSLEQAISDPETHAVDICNANADHYPAARASLAGGKHVLIEKPVAMKTEEIEDLIQVAKARGLIACAVFQKRFNRTIQRVKELIHRRLHGVLFSHSLVHMPRSEGYYDDPQKRTQELAGGGVLIYQAIHDLDLLIQLFGPIEKVTGFRENLHHKIEVEDTVHLLLKFRNGPTSYLHASTAPQFPAGSVHLLYGGSRFLVFDHERAEVFPRRVWRRWEMLWHLSGAAARFRRTILRRITGASSVAGTYSDVLADFHAAISDRSVQPVTSLETTLETHRVIECFYETSLQNT